MKRLLVTTVFLTCLALIIGACARPQQINSGSAESDAAGQWHYTRFNIHYFHSGPDLKASCVNYINSGMFLPYNTKCRIGSWEQGFSLQPVDKNLTILFEYSPSYMAGLPQNAYLDLILSPTPVQYPDLSKLDREGIEMGQAQTGMTKKGVKIALGYPARHKTPTLKSDKWIYWKSRLVTKAIYFNNNGRVTNIK